MMLFELENRKLYEKVNQATGNTTTSSKNWYHKSYISNSSIINKDTKIILSNVIRKYITSIYYNDSWHRCSVPLQSVQVRRFESIVGSSIAILMIIMVFTFKRGYDKKKTNKKYKDKNDVLFKKMKSDVIEENCNSTTNSFEEKRMNIEQKLDFKRRVGLHAYGYSSTPGGYIDVWRKQELPGLIAPLPAFSKQEETCYELESTNIERIEQEVYLDYAGSALPTQSQLKEIISTTTTLPLANPHSIGPAALRTKQYIEQAKKRILDHFLANPGKFYGTLTTAPNSDNDIDYHPGYEIVFTSGTTDAMRIIAERFPWGYHSDLHPHHHLQQQHDEQRTQVHSSFFVYAQNSHTSVIGMREEALQHQLTKIVCQPIDLLMKTIHGANSNFLLEDAFNKLSFTDQLCDIDKNDQQGNVCRFCTNHLLVLPLECNFGGDRFDVQSAFQKLNELDRSTIIDGNRCANCQHKASQQHQQWYTMLDIAKAASTGPINLCQLNPDFACISFYKLFGEPTGLGCLLVKRTAIDILFTTNNNTHSNTKLVSPSLLSKKRLRFRRKYIGGGSVDIIVPSANYTVPRSEPSLLVSLTNGTPHFRGVVSLLAGFNEMDRVGGMKSIHRHTQCLTQELVRRLRTLRHGNRQAAIEIYGNWKNFECTKVSGTMPNFCSGPTVAFNVVRADGSYVGYNEVSKLAALNHPPIQLRTGCFCNPGACQMALQLSNNDVILNYEESGHTCGDPIDTINNRPIGAIRISFGKDSIWEDLNALVLFLEKMFVNYIVTQGEKSEQVSNSRTPAIVTITELYIFPIKSCAAQRVPDWQIDRESGRLRFDREFALIDSSGSAMRMQMYPAMALLQPLIDLKNQTLTIQAPGSSCSNLLLHLDDRSPFNKHNKSSSVVKVCGNRCAAYLWGDHAVSEWFSRHLGVRCWLARHSVRKDGLYEHPELASSQIPLSVSSLSFANEQPLLLISEQAVHALNKAMRVSCREIKPLHNDSVCSRQFRPNIVITNSSDTYTINKCNRHLEDCWSRISVVSENPQDIIVFDVTGPCARCAMVDIDPLNGRKKKALRALATYRRSGHGQINFGIFLRATTTNESVSLESNCPKWQRLSEGDLLLCE
jgi:molybdenum cofactor sulfurtransferase